MARRSGTVGDEIFSVEEFPRFAPKVREPRPDPMGPAVEKVKADPSRVHCIRQYESRGSAEGMRTSLTKRFPDVTFKVGPLEDGRVGVFAKAETPAPRRSRKK